MAAVVIPTPPAWPLRAQVSLPQGPDVAVPTLSRADMLWGQTSCLQLRVHPALTGACTYPPLHSAHTPISRRMGPSEAAIIFSCQNQTLF